MLTYLIRHGESLYNLDPQFGLNSSLSPRGMSQAEAVAARLRSVHIAAIYSSPFDRCLQTASCIIGNRNNQKVRVRPELWEYHGTKSGAEAAMGTGLASITEVCNQHVFAEPCPDYTGSMAWPRMDEPFDSMLTRVRTFAQYLKSRWTGPDDTVVIISHGSPIARLIEAWLTDVPGPSFRFVIENAAITALRYESGVNPATTGVGGSDGVGHPGVSSLICLNEISHLTTRSEPGVSANLISLAGSNFNADGTVKPRRSSSYW